MAARKEPIIELKTHTSSTSRPTFKTSLRPLFALSTATVAVGQMTQSTTLPNGGSPNGSGVNQDWDVDNDGTVDFAILGRYFSTSNTGYASFLDQNGGRVFGAATNLDDPFLKLNYGQTIGGSVSGFGFAANAQRATVTVSSNAAFDATQGGWGSNETGYIGFKFTSGASTHYGWAEVNINGGGIPGYNYTINEAWYQATADSAVFAGMTTSPVPEPSTYAAGLGALALGAAGLRRWRLRRQAT